MSYAKKRYQDRIKKAFGNQDQKEKDDEGVIPSTRVETKGPA